jgi:transcriptional regulator with XRE-family HTH domain
MSSKNLHLKRVEPCISAGIVRRLQKREGMTLKEIGEKMGGLSHSFISQVKSGSRSLTMARLLMLEKELDRPLPIIFLQGVEEICGARKLKGPYKLLKDWLTKSAQLKDIWEL